MSTEEGSYGDLNRPRDVKDWEPDEAWWAEMDRRYGDGGGGC